MKEVITNFIEKIFNPPSQTRTKSDARRDLETKFAKSLYVKEHLKSRMWVDIEKPSIHKQIESGLGTLIRDGLTMNELQLKTTIAEIRTQVNKLSEMRYIIEEGEKAGIKLERMS